MASTDRPTANATATRPADGAEKSAAPHTAVTSANVPINSAPSSLPICLPPRFSSCPNRQARTTWFNKCNRRATGPAPACAVPPSTLATPALRERRLLRRVLGGLLLGCGLRFIDGLQRLRMRHRDDVVAAVDVVDVAGDAGREIGQE